MSTTPLFARAVACIIVADSQIVTSRFSNSFHAVFEALVMGRKAGLDPLVMRQALLGGSAQSAVLANHALRWMEGRFTPGFRAELMLKDLRLAAESLAAQGVYSPVAAATPKGR